MAASVPPCGLLNCDAQPQLRKAALFSLVKPPENGGLIHYGTSPELCREFFKTMPADANERRSQSFDSSDEMGMRKRLSLSLEAEQGQRLLLRDPENVEADDDKQECSVEWHLRTGWAIAGSLLAAALVFLLMVLFTTYYIVEAIEPEFSVQEALSGDFRRPMSDYTLDPDWNFRAARRVRRFEWTILDRVANPDGIFRPMITINGKFPGPMIECNEGDTLVIDVDNQSVNATSIHFHGIFQNGTNWMDGTNGVTQCPIAPKGKFQYKFTVTGQSGTYFYHGHQAIQIADGLFGPLVIHSRDEKKLRKITYDTDRVIMLQDYYHDLSSGLLRASLSPGSETDPIPDGALINGLNTRNCDLSPNRLCDNSTTKLPSFQLASNSNHRLRFINVGAYAWFGVSLDQHALAITEVDGTNILPSYQTQMYVSPGQRYSTIITTNQTTDNGFWLRARMVTNCFSDPELPGGGADEVRAIVQYSETNFARPLSAVVTQPVSRNWDTGFAVQCQDMDHTQFVPYPDVPAPVTADHSYFIRSNIEIGGWRLQRGFFNKSTFRPDLRLPSLHRTLQTLSFQNETVTKADDGVNDASFSSRDGLVIQHKGIKVVDLIIQNFDEGNHPMHLHGHKFWVLGQGHGYFPGYDELNLDFSNPLKRDTATLEGYGWMLLRFVTDNPGMWAFHCHLAWHSEAGLLMQILSQPEAMASWELPEANKQLCNAGGLEKGAAPKDEVWFGVG